LGLSGGVDSVVLLHVLARFCNHGGFRLSALHVHHGLSPHAEAWTGFCARLCADWQLPLNVVRLQVDRDSGLGLEAAAREARYGAYADAEADVIVLAHHRDDQAETLLLNLLRGAGVQGAAAMPECRPLIRNPLIRNPSGPGGATLLLRPLLGVSRVEIEAYARRHELSWIEDESNDNHTFSRNFLRAEVLPRLHGRFPGGTANLARSAGYFAEASELLSDLAEIDLGPDRPDGGLPLDALACLGEARGRNLLRHWLLKRGVIMPDARHLAEIRRQLLSSDVDAEPVMALLGHGRRLTLRRFRGLAHVVPEMGVSLVSPWRGEPVLPWAGGSVHFTRSEGGDLRADRLERASCLLRPRQGGEYFRPDARRPRRSLKKLLQESPIPPWQREVLPCLWCGDELVWVAGLGVAADWQCGERDQGWIVSWRS
jgi:tRNA(Ile)-lysidine synthase